MPRLLVGALLGFFMWPAGSLDLSAAASGRPSLTGPLVGFVDSTTAKIWAHIGKEHALEVRYQRDGAGPVWTQQMPASQAENYVARATLSSLEPRTRYTYEIWSTEKLAEGVFTTAPSIGASGRSIFAVTSCMKRKENSQDPDEDGFGRLLQRKPSFQLLIGDNVYADTTDHDAIWKKHIDQRAAAKFNAAIAKIPTLAVWDDHDYATNGSDKTAKGKDQSLKAFKELFANPAAGLPEEDGVFFRFSWGDVDFFMLDVRYWRDKVKDPITPSKTILGPKQFDWLETGLKSSTAKFKVIASGSPWVNARQGEKETDDWSSYPYSQKRLLEIIRDNNCAGVILLTGDRHRCEINRHAEVPADHPYKSGIAGKDGVLPYPLYEVVSSGIAKYKCNHEPNPNAVYGSFALLNVNTSITDPTVKVEIVDKTNVVVASRLIYLSELSPPFAIPPACTKDTDSQ
jgi:alkaline phosphatase D